jgi:hypothetical protein
LATTPLALGLRVLLSVFYQAPEPTLTLGSLPAA